MQAETPVLNPAFLAAVAEASLPEVTWLQGDDLCDCTFQRIGMWTNPYIARTLKVRLCCIWEEIYAQYPQHVQRIPAFFDYSRSNEDPENAHEVYEIAPRDWDGDSQMPRSLWHRQIATRTGKELTEVREEMVGETPPGPAGKLPPEFWLPRA